MGKPGPSSPLGQASAADREPSTGARAWHAVTAEKGRFRVMMPLEPVVTRKTSDTSQGPVQFLSHKASAGGVFWNFLLVEYPEAIIEANPDAVAFLNRIAEGNLRQKVGSRQESLRTLDEAGHPAIEQKFRYPAGRNSLGQYSSGYAIHRLYRVGRHICWLFVDISDAARETNPAQIEADTARFFGSLGIDG
jgi:hypothetical protein